MAGNTKGQDIISYPKMKDILPEIPESKRSLARDLFTRANFMLRELRKLEKTITKNGCVSEYQNGENQWGTKKSPEVEVYNTMIKNYAMAIRQINDMLPNNENTGGIKDDGFDSFANRI